MVSHQAKIFNRLSMYRLSFLHWYDDFEHDLDSSQPNNILENDLAPKVVKNDLQIITQSDISQFVTHPHRIKIAK